jgi:uncharacterized protein YqhQ
MKKKYANVGGQAVMEGIMMRSPKKSVLAVRSPDGTITTEDMKYTSISDKIKFLKLPILRGMAAFIESMFVGYKSLTRSAELSGLEEETKGNKVLETFVMVLSFILGITIAIAIFIVLPVFLVTMITKAVDFGIFKTLVEGCIRVVLFVLYIVAVSKMKDIRRLFEYHGAEHKTIFCFESGEELTIENVKKHPRLHPRCGTSFLFLVMIVGILFFSFLTWSNPVIRVFLKLALMPVVAGVSFEFIILAGKYDNLFTRIISAPGKALQKITTKEPDDGQIEVAIAALKASLTNDSGDGIDVDAAYTK